MLVAKSRSPAVVHVSMGVGDEPCDYRSKSQACDFSANIENTRAHTSQKEIK